MPELYSQEYPGPPGSTPLVLVHGLFGSHANWRGIAKRLGADRRSLLMDMRNHGRSFKDEEMTYPQMARDVLDSLDADGTDRADLLGHSMGGKAAMVAALEAPDRVEHLIVVDIAPVVYTHSHASLVEAMMEVDVAGLESRGEAEAQLEEAIDDRMTRQFLLQSLEKADRGYRWRLNLRALRNGMGDLTGFPELEGGTFDGPVLFISGAASDYVLPEHRPRIERYFPNAQYAAVDGAGHWVHADQPEALIEIVAEFLDG